MELTFDKKQLDPKLKAKELYFLIDDLKIGFFQISLDGKIISHNQALKTILEYAPNDNLSDSAVSLFCKNAEDREIYRNQLLRNHLVTNYLVELIK